MEAVRKAGRRWWRNKSLELDEGVEIASFYLFRFKIELTNSILCTAATIGRGLPSTSSILVVFARGSASSANVGYQNIIS
jgi:hypothetical protein